MPMDSGEAIEKRPQGTSPANPINQQNQQQQLPILLTPDEVASILRVPLSLLVDLTRQHKIECVRINLRVKRYTQAHVDAFIHKMSDRGDHSSEQLQIQPEVPKKRDKRNARSPYPFEPLIDEEKIKEIAKQKSHTIRAAFKNGRLPK